MKLEAAKRKLQERYQEAENGELALLSTPTKFKFYFDHS